MERSEERLSASAQSGNESEEEFLIPFFPNHLLKEVACVFLVLGILLTTSVLFPYDLTPPSSPSIESEEIGPAWYFNWTYVTLKFLPTYFPADVVKFAVPILFVILALILLIMPFIERSTSHRVRDRKLFVVAAIWSIVSYTILTIIPKISH